MVNFDEDDDFEEIDPDYEDGDPTGRKPKFLKVAMEQDYNLLQQEKIDRLIEIYREVRDQLATDRKAFKERETLLKDYLARLGMLLKDKADSIGVDSFPTKAGTAYRLKKERFPIEDWKALTDWIGATGNYQVLQHRTSSVAVREIREEGGELPPGVGYYSEVTFTVRANARKAPK